MSELTVTQISPPTIAAWQVTTATAQDAVTAINTAVTNGMRAQVNIVNDNGVPTWTVTLMQSGYPNITANQGDWIVSDGAQLVAVSNTDFLATYTANTALVWAATSVAPVATAQSGLQATISCPTPMSANGPWTFSCTITNSTSGSITTETVGDAVVANDQVSFTASDLIEGDTYTFQIVCDTQYDGVTATSLASASITATS
jgi:hypothetical protein